MPNGIDTPHGGMIILSFLLAILLECGVGPLDGSRAAILEHRVGDPPVLYRRGLSSRRLVNKVAKTVITRSIGRNISLNDQAKLSLTRQCLILEFLTCHFDEERLTSHAPTPPIPAPKPNVNVNAVLEPPFTLLSSASPE